MSADPLPPASAGPLSHRVGSDSRRHRLEAEAFERIFDSAVEYGRQAGADRAADALASSHPTGQLPSRPEAPAGMGGRLPPSMSGAPASTPAAASLHAMPAVGGSVSTVPNGLAMTTVATDAVRITTTMHADRPAAVRALMPSMAPWKQASAQVLRTDGGAQIILRLPALSAGQAEAAIRRLRELAADQGVALDSIWINGERVWQAQGRAMPVVHNELSSGETKWP